MNSIQKRHSDIVIDVGMKADIEEFAVLPIGLFSNAFGKLSTPYIYKQVWIIITIKVIILFGLFALFISSKYYKLMQKKTLYYSFL